MDFSPQIRLADSFRNVRSDANAIYLPICVVCEVQYNSYDVIAIHHIKIIHFQPKFFLAESD